MGRTIGRIESKPGETGRKRGRPSVLTLAIQRAICRSVEQGNYLQVAAEAAGISRATIFRWLAEADGGDAQFVVFRDAVKKAQAKAEARALAAIMNAGKRSWVPFAWYLERAHPDRWRRREHNDDPLEALPEAQEREEEPLMDKLSLALQRHPNEIERAMAAITVLEEILAMDRADAPARHDTNSVESLR